MAKAVKKKNINGKTSGVKANVAKSKKKPAPKAKVKLEAKKATPNGKKLLMKAANGVKAAKAVLQTKATALIKGAKPSVPPSKPPSKALGTKAAKEQPEVKSKLSKSEKKAEVLAQLLAEQQKTEAEVVLTNADGKEYCRVHDCDNEATTDGHCRFHYLALWKRNRIKAKILQGGKLDKYIEDLTSKYPDKYLEMLRKDLASEKDFNVIVAEMDVEDSGDEAEQEEDANRFIEEVRGGMPTTDDDEGGF